MRKYKSQQFNPIPHAVRMSQPSLLFPFDSLSCLSHLQKGFRIIIKHNKKMQNKICYMLDHNSGKCPYCLISHEHAQLVSLLYLYGCLGHEHAYTKKTNECLAHEADGPSL